MKLAFFIARRYFFSKKKKNFIHVISIISMVVVATGTMALVIVLSVFNGLEGLLRSLYGTVDPHLIVTPAYGKSFEYTDEMERELASVQDILEITEVAEDNALVKYNDVLRAVRVKGVSENFIDLGRLDQSIVFGELVLTENGVNYAIVGRGVQYDLAINPNNKSKTLQFFYPRNVEPGAMNPDKMFRTKYILPGSVFAIEKNYDENYIYVPLTFALELFGYEKERTALEIQIRPEAQAGSVKNKLADFLGKNFIIRSNEEIHGDLYKILKIEKFFVFLVFSMIIAIASINIFFSLTMLAIDKKKDIAILSAQGAPQRLIRNVFLAEGCIVAFTGAFTGLILGLAISFAQQEFGFISLGMETAIVESYPVKIKALDILYTVLSIIVITIITSVQPAIKASKKFELKNLQ